MQDIVHGYNNSYHRSIGQSPASVSSLNVGQVRRKLYGNSWAKPIRDLKFKLGDQVHISKLRRTFKKGYLPSWTHMWKYFTSKNTLVYIDILQDIVHGYNNSYHRSIGQSPASVSLLNVGQVRRKLYGNSWAKPIRDLKFKLGDQVHISKLRRTFKKGYLPSWTQKIFIVTKIIPRVPPVYRL